MGGKGPLEVHPLCSKQGQPQPTWGLEVAQDRVQLSISKDRDCKLFGQPVPAFDHLKKCTVAQ